MMKFKTFCACLALLYAGDVIAVYDGLLPHDDHRGRSIKREKDESRSRSTSRSKSSSQDRNVDIRKNTILEMSWAEYVSDQPKGDINITDEEVDIKFEELKFINEKISFSNLTKLSIADSFGLRFSDSSSDEDSDDASIDNKNDKNYEILRDVLSKFSDKFSTLKELTISDLKNLPTDIGGLRGLTKLDLHGNGLKKLPPTIGNLRNLTELNLADNELTKPPMTMISLHNLKELDLSENKEINSIYKIPFSVLSRLRKLELVVFTDDNGRIQKYDKLKLASLGNMTWIDYARYRPKGIVAIQDESLVFGRYGRYDEYGLNLDDILLVNGNFSFPRLASLSIGGQSWSSEYEKSLSILLSKSPNLGELTIYNKNLTEIPKEIEKLINLKKLDLSAINLTKLPNDIGDLKNLKELKISSRVLTELPKEIGKLINLEKLDLSDTGLTKLPNEIGDLKNLKELKISSRVLTELPKGIGGLINLEFLDLSDTGLTKLPEEIGNLTTLHDLYLANTGLTEFPKEMRKLSNLSDLNLENNEVFDSIEKIPDEILDLPNLNSVRWGDNKARTQEEKERREQKRIKTEEKRREDEENKKRMNKWAEDLEGSSKKAYSRGRKYPDSQIDFSLQTPLADWPVLRKFDFEGEENYYHNETWDKTKTLAENQKALVDKFIRECCDFSAKKSDYFGNSEQKHIIAIDSAEKYRGKFINLFSKIVENPVGCEFLRVILTKRVVNNLDKVMFVPVEDTNGLNTATMYDARIYQCMVFTQKFWEEYFIIAMERDNKSNEIQMRRRSNPSDSILLHELLHSVHSDNRRIRKTTITKRMPFLPLHPGVYDQMDGDNLKQYTNDEEYHTMFGLTEKGLDLINESSYLVHRYGYIRSSHASLGKIRDAMRIDGMRQNGLFDENLYEFYLSPEFKERCPKFGIGDFECSDLDSRTGKKLTSAK